MDAFYISFLPDCTDQTEVTGADIFPISSLRESIPSLTIKMWLQGFCRWVLLGWESSFLPTLSRIFIMNEKWKWKSQSNVRLSGTPWNSGIQARILQWVAPFSRGSSQPRDQTQVSRVAGGFFTSWATREPLYRIHWWFIHSPCYEHWIVSSCIHLCLQLNWYQITIMKLKLTI